MGMVLLCGAIQITVWILASNRCYLAQKNQERARAGYIKATEDLRQAEANLKAKLEAGRERRLAILMGEDAT